MFLVILVHEIKNLVTIGFRRQVLFLRGRTVWTFSSQLKTNITWSNNYRVKAKMQYMLMRSAIYKVLMVVTTVELQQTPMRMHNVQFSAYKHNLYLKANIQD